MLGKYAQGNWLFYLFGVVLVIIVLWFVGRYFLKSFHKPQDTFYFSVIDEAGNKSCIHDSGIRPSKKPPGSALALQVLKTEYNNGKSKSLARPSLIKMGMHPQELKWSLTPERVDNEKLYYIAHVKTPSHPFVEKGDV